MRYRSERLLAAAALLGLATLASAQANNGSQTQQGFFRPSANPNLTAPGPAEVAPVNPATRPTEALTAEDHVQAPQENVAADRAPDPMKVMRWSEQQADRSEQDAAKAKEDAARRPQPINGAFTGQTNERDR